MILTRIFIEYIRAQYDLPTEVLLDIRSSMLKEFKRGFDVDVYSDWLSSLREGREVDKGKQLQELLKKVKEQNIVT